MSTAPQTQTITADQLQPGDVITQLRRDHVPEHPQLSVGRVQIEDVSPRDGGLISVRWHYSSRNCRMHCYDHPYSCRHYGEAGGGTGQVLATQKLERYTK